MAKDWSDVSGEDVARLVRHPETTEADIKECADKLGKHQGAAKGKQTIAAAGKLLGGRKRK